MIFAEVGTIIKKNLLNFSTDKILSTHITDMLTEETGTVRWTVIVMQED